MGKDVRRDIANRDLGRALGRKIARLERHVRELETASQAAFRSVEDGSIDIYDDNGVLRDRIGKQTDGSYGRKTFTGDIPPAPTEPDVQVISDGVVAVTWDGRWEEAYSHVGWRNVQIHLGDTETFTPDRDTQVGAIFAPRGGTIVAVTESDDDNPVWVRLVGMNDAGQTGDPSVAVLVDELDEDDLEEVPEELQWEDGDGHTLTQADLDAGTVTFGLSHIPEEESLLAWWHPGGLGYAGVPQAPGDDFTVDYEAASVTWPLTGREAVDDRLRVYYPYYEPGLLVPYGSGGWSYLQVSLSDTADYSPAGFDDSGWTVGTAPFGGGTGTPEAAVTAWAANTSLWLRRTLPALTSATISIRIEDHADIYVNGTLIASTPAQGTENALMNQDQVFTVPTAALNAAGDNVLAVRCYDEPETGTGDPTWADVQVDGQ